MVQLRKFIAASRNDLNLFHDKPFVVDKLIVAGVWCLESRARFSDKVADFCLNDPWLSKRVYIDRCSDCWQAYQNTIEAIHQSLAIGVDGNVISKREISILVGPVLSRVLPIYFHSSDLVAEVLKQQAGDEKIMMFCPELPSRPKSSQIAVALCASDDLFTFVFHQILKNKIGQRLISQRRDGNYASSYIVTSPVKIRRRIKIYIAKFFARLFRNKTILVGSYLTFKQWLLLMIEIRSPILNVPVNPHANNVSLSADKDLRALMVEKIIQVTGDRIFAELICILLPTSVVERYLEEKTSRDRRFFAKNLLTSIADISFDDEIRRNIAHCISKGGRLITLQHGGVYGSQAFSFIENLQIFNCDYFMTWGWSDKDTKALPLGRMPASKAATFQLEENIKIGIIMVSFGSKYYHMFLSPQSTKYRRYLEELTLISSSLCSKFPLKVRKYFNDYDWEIDGIFDNLEVEVSNPSKESVDVFVDQVDLVIVTYDSTTHLDLVRSGQPFVLFFSENYYEQREDIFPFDALVEARVLHTNPESLVRFLHDTNLKTWWASDEVKAGLSKLARTYSRENNSFIKDLGKFL